MNKRGLAILGLVAIGVIAKFTLDYRDYSIKKSAGYCFAQERYLEPEEFRSLAIEAIVKRFAELQEGADPELKKQLYVYSDAAHFREQNPLWTQSVTLPRKYNKWLHDTYSGAYFSGGVSVRFLNRDTDNTTTVSYFLDPCGKVMALKRLGSPGTLPSENLYEGLRSLRDKQK